MKCSCCGVFYCEPKMAVCDRCKAAKDRLGSWPKAKEAVTKQAKKDRRWVNDNRQRLADLTAAIPSQGDRVIMKEALDFLAEATKETAPVK